MPFGLDLMSVAVGFLTAYFLLPWVLSIYYRNRNTSTTAG